MTSPARGRDSLPRQRVDCSRAIPLKVALVVLLATPLFSTAAGPATAGSESTGSLFELPLEEIMRYKIVTAKRKEQPVAAVPASLMVITRSDIERYGYTSLDEILREIPGLFAINDYGPAAPSLGVRGFWSGEANRNLIILVNGVKQLYDFDSTYPLWRLPVPVESIERIEVVRGPMSVIYGSGALFGVINIMTTGFSTGELGPSLVSLAAGSREYFKLSGRHSSSAYDGKLRYTIDGAYYRSAGIDQSYRKLSSRPFPAEWGVTIDESTEGTLSVDERYAHAAVASYGLTLDVTYAEVSSGEHFLLPTFGHDDGGIAHRKSLSFSLQYQLESSQRWQLNARLGYFKTDFNAEYEYLFRGFEGEEEIDVRAWEAEVDCSLALSETLNLTLGINHRMILEIEDYYSLPSFGDPMLIAVTERLDDDQITIRAAYAELEYEPNDRLRLIAGARVEDLSGYDLGQYRWAGEAVRGSYAGDGSEVVARIGAIYRLGEHNVVKLLYGEAINRPSWFQNMKGFLDADHGPIVSEGIQTFELNLISTSLPGITLSTSLFRNELSHLITRLSALDVNGSYQSWFSNAGTMITHGVEATARLEPHPEWQVELSLTLQRSDDRRDGFEEIDVAYSPELLAYLKTSYSLGERSTIALTGTYVAPMYPYWDLARPAADGSMGARIGDQSESYVLLNAAVLIKDVIAGWDLRLRCSNLLDQEIRYPITNSNQWADRGTLDHQRAFLVSLRRQY